MTIAEVRAGVQRIAAIADDSEAAHADADTLHIEVLQAIAEGAEKPAELAAAALKTLDIKFARWCA